MKATPPRVIEASTGLLALLTLTAGLWAMIAPGSFYLTVAPFPPYSQHLIHDIGAFQIGLGACLAAGLLVQDALVAVLAGNALAGAAHFVSHVLDRFDGGHASDPATIGALALLLTLLTVLRWATSGTRRKPTRSAIDQGDPS